jgi:hypothetical protein
VSRKIHGDWPLAVGTRLGVGAAVNFTGTAVGQTLHIPCARGHMVDFKIAGHTAPDAVAKRMLGQGWTIGRKLLCPKHARKTKAIPAPVPGEQEEPMSEPEIALPAHVELPPPAVTVKPVASERAKAAQREALKWLDESFNIEKGTYAAGVSDATIAKEAGISTAAVAQLREQFFGPLKAPSEVEEMRLAFKTCRDKISATGDELRQMVRALELKLDRFCEKNNW